MGGKSRATSPTDTTGWNASRNEWVTKYDPSQDPPPAAAPEPEPVAAAAPEPAAAVQEQAAPAAAAPQGPIGEPISPGKATTGSIATTKDTGKKLASSITAAPETWTDQMKKQSAGGAGSITTTGQV